MSITSPDLPEFVRAPRVRRALGGLSVARMDALVRDGLLPTPIKIGARTTLFRRDELDAALERLRTRAA